MKFITTKTGAFLGLLVFCFLVAASQPAMAEAPAFGFGKLVAGSFLIENLDLPDAGLEDLQAMATIGADGTVFATDTDDFGLAQTAPHSPKHGAWAQTGKREISITVLEFAYDASGVQHQFTWRLEFTVEFDGRDFDTGSGELVVKLFPVPYQPGLDPLDPDAVPVFAATGTFDFRRIKP